MMIGTFHPQTVPLNIYLGYSPPDIFSHMHQLIITANRSWWWSGVVIIIIIIIKIFV